MVEVVAEDLLDPAPRGVLTEAGRHPAVDLHVGAGGDHVHLVRGVGHRRRHRHAEHRLDDGQQRRRARSDPLERRLWILRVCAQPAQQRGGSVGDVEPGLLCGESLEHRGQLEQRVLTGPGQRGVTGDAAGSELEAEDPLLAAADAVAAGAVELEHMAPALVEQHVAADLVGMLLGQPAGADVPARLLIGDEHELQRAARRAPPVAGERRAGDRLRGDLGLHVERAPAPQVAVFDVAGPRVVLPVRRVGQHRVDVAEVAERGPRL